MVWSSWPACDFKGTAFFFPSSQPRHMVFEQNCKPKMPLGCASGISATAVKHSSSPRPRTEDQNSIAHSCVTIIVRYVNHLPHCNWHCGGVYPTSLNSHEHPSTKTRHSKACFARPCTGTPESPEPSLQEKQSAPYISSSPLLQYSIPLCEYGQFGKIYILHPYCSLACFSGIFNHFLMHVDI